MWENLLEKTTLTISFTHSHDKCEQNKYNINRHHEITRNIYNVKAPIYYFGNILYIEILVLWTNKSKCSIKILINLIRR